MHVPERLRDYLTFNRKDRIGALIFLVVAGGSILLPTFFSSGDEPLVLTRDTSLAMALDTLRQRRTDRSATHRYADADHLPYEPRRKDDFTNAALFSFDPNTASFADWRRLGLSERTSQTILKYVAKGGRFYKPEDLQRIWSLPHGFYERVRPYITITTTKREWPTPDRPPFVREERKPVVVEVNAADTNALIALPGIGSKLSARIVNFRDKLGGFHSIDQVGETWGLPDSTFQKIKGRLQVSGEVRKLNANTATKDELKAHPYIRWALANAIVEYRNQHGPFKALNDLRNIVLIDEQTFQKLSPYLVL